MSFFQSELLKMHILKRVSLQDLSACLPLLVPRDKVPHGLSPSLHVAASPLQSSQRARGEQRRTEENREVFCFCFVGMRHWLCKYTDGCLKKIVSTIL